MPPSVNGSHVIVNDRDALMVVTRLLTLWTGFYLAGAAALQLISIAMPASSLQLHHVDLDRNLTEGKSGNLDKVWSDAGSTPAAASFVSIKCIMLMGVMLPSLLWFLLDRLLVLLCTCTLVLNVVERYHSVADYVVSVYALHTLVAIVVYGPPRVAGFWITVVLECIFCVTISEYLVARREYSHVERVVRAIEHGGEDAPV